VTRKVASGLVAGVVAGLVLATASPLQAQTCEFPWGPDWDPTAKFEVGAHYMDPYSNVIEILGSTCRAWDEWAGGRVCVRAVLGVRNVKGRAIRTSVGKGLVYVENGLFYYANGEFPAETPLDNGKWGKLPIGCYPTTTVAFIEGDVLTVRK